MNCDQVFMILTRGPFPTGEAWDEKVEAHLEWCGECWRLAEALRPALEVFQEAVPAAESRDLPGYWGDARPADPVTSGLSPLEARHAPSSVVGQTARLKQCVSLESSQAYRELRTGLTGEVLRAAVLASTMTAAVIGLFLLWRG